MEGWSIAPILGHPQLLKSQTPLQTGVAIRLTLPASLEKMRLVAAGMAAESRYFPLLWNLFARWRIKALTHLERRYALRHAGRDVPEKKSCGIM